MLKDIPKFILSISLCLGAGFIGSIFTTSSIPTWYATLNKPFFSPPNWIFAPVWTILYILMGISLYLIQTSRQGRGSPKAAKIKNQNERTKVFGIFGIQLFLNVLWSIVFFGMRNPTLAFVNIIALWIAIFLTIKSFYKINKLAGNLLIPYLLWVSFASLLNLSIVILNP